MPLSNPIFRKISRIAGEQGVRAFVVGGYVRDHYLRRPSTDIDVVVVGKYPFSVDLSEGRYLVDAKSLMGIFSLDLLQPIKLIAEKDDPNLFEELKDIIVEV